VLQAGQDRRNERLQDFFLSYPAEISQHDTSEVFIGVPQVVPEVLAY
jgi:hypothetical protein